MRFLSKLGVPSAVVLALCGTMLFLYGNIDYVRYSQWNLAEYRLMAQASPWVNTQVPQPFVYRILGPYLAGLLPVSDPTGFRILSLLACPILSVLLYRFLRYQQIHASIAVTCTVLYLFNPFFFGFASWDYFQIGDLLSLIYVLVLLWSLLERNWLAFGLVLLLAALTRETAMIMVPVGLGFLAERKTLRKDARSFLLAVVPGVAVFLALRVVIHPVSGDTLPEALVRFAGKALLPVTWFQLLIRPFIPLGFLPLLFPSTTLSFFRKRKFLLFYVGLLLFSAFFGSVNANQRLMAPTFVVFYWLVATIIQTHFPADNRITGMLLACGFVSSLHYQVARFPITRGLTATLSAGSLLFVTAVVYLADKRKHRARTFSIAAELRQSAANISS